MLRKVVLVLLGIQEYDIRCSLRAVAARERHLAIDGPSAGIANRDTIVQRHKKGI